MNSNPVSGAAGVSKVRASREGHTYHDTWTARVALELLVPTTNLSAIAVEGLSTEDAAIVSAAATEVADLVRYRGGIGISYASRVEVVQFKYSIAEAAVPVRAADLRKTVLKFAKTDTDFSAAVGAERVRDVVRYEFVTNRPLHANLLAAIEGLCQGIPLSGDIADQAQAVTEACNLDQSTLPSFLNRLTLSGQQSNVAQVKAAVHRTIANWGGATDTLSRMRLSNVLQLCRDKAGAVGQFNNLIVRVDLLAALEIANEEELYPTPDAFPTVGQVISRSVVDTVTGKIQEEGTPVLVHAPGGMGKTVVMQALAQRFDRSPHAVVLFDCFGAGRWRDPADGRHLVQRALPHIANLLASRGLCDVLLSGGATMDLAKAFRARLAQAVSAVRAVDTRARVVLLLDAIDHSALQAGETHTEAFSHVVLKSLVVAPIEGVSVVVSCRTERREIAKGGAECREVPIGPFSPDETATMVQLREGDITDAEMAALHTRSGGNPRIVDALLRAGRPFDHLDPNGDAPRVPADLLDRLLTQRIEDASREAVSRGLSQAEVDVLLAGLALLPPPVPLVELALALDRPEAAVESFASDLYPLLDRTPHGLIFRDEPTETLIRRVFRSDPASQAAIIERLERRQVHSSYAARALPIVLTSLGRTDDLIELAFDDRLPQSATSRVAQRAIRLSRLVAALVACSTERRGNDLTELLLEAARVAGGHQRSDSFLLEHPDLVAVSDDPEAVRRLFEVKSGWPGSRHSALAILQTLSNEQGEARRNARRALAWLNWRAQQPKERPRPRERASTDEQDVVGPAYVEALAGNTTRVGRWLDQWSERHAYTLYSQLVELMERHAAVSSDATTVRQFVINRAVRCRSKSRALGGALLQHADLGIEDARRVIRRLAAISASSGPVPNDFDYARREHGFADALVTAAMRAVQLGQTSDARAILDGIGIPRLRLHHFSSHFPNTNEIIRYLLAAAVRASIDQRSLHLMDVAPDEIHTALRLRKPVPTARAYEKAVARLLAPPAQTTEPRRRRRKPRLDAKEREEAIRVLDHRVRPLLPLVSAVAQLLRTDQTDAEVASAIDRLERLAASADVYPFRDGPQYTARIAFGLVANTVSALELLSAANSKRLVEWLVDSPIKHITLWNDVIAMLSRRPDTRASALILAERAAALIRADTNIGDRITASGALARAIWRTSRAEARGYFRRGLDIADAIGSDDYDRAADLIEFATHYDGAPLRLEAVHTFARICELTLHDEDRFPWTTFGEAVARIAGIHGLPIVARMADREKASLALSLPPLLTALVKQGRLKADLAVALIGLDAATETWSWNFAAFAEAVIPRVAPELREQALRIILIELDRQYQGYPPSGTIEGIDGVCRKHLSASSPVLLQLHELMAVRTAQIAASKDVAEPTPRFPGGNDWEQRSVSVDPFDAATIDAALMQGEAERVGRPAVQLLTALAERVPGVDDRLRFLKAVADTRVPTLADKLLALEDLLKAWREQSVAIADFIPTLVGEMSVRHADELIGSDWDSSYALRKLIEFSGQAPLVVVASVIEALRGRAADVGGSAWMRFACMAAPTAEATAIGAALERFTSMAALDLPEEVADGTWRVELAAADEPLQSVGGLLWLRLGSPVSAERWRAAHVVRRLVAMGNDGVVAVLVNRFDSDNARPYQDERLPFLVLHARYWLLIALARIGVDQPEAIVPCRSLLERVAFATAERHVGMQAFAADALRRVADLLPTSEGAALDARLEGISVSPFPRSPESKGRRDFYHPSPREAEDSENPFHFEYEYSKSEVDGLASVFGLDHADVVSMATAWVRRWSTDIKNMWDCPRRPHSEYGDWSRRTSGRHTWGAYLAWHSLMLTAGELLPTMPVTDCFYREDPWTEWLADYRLSRSDGLWLSDATDVFPPDVIAPVVPPDSGADVPADPSELRWLAGLSSADMLPGNTTIDGSWKSRDGLDVTIDSVVVIPELAETVAHTVLTVEPFDRWFPQEGDLSRGFRRRLPLRRLFREPLGSERKLDQDDPFASPTALRRPRASRAAVRILRLRAADPVTRAWFDPSHVGVLSTEAWGVDREGRDDDAGRSGSRVRISAPGLLAFLKSTRRSLVLLVKVQKYLKDDNRAAVLAKRRRRKNSERHIPFRTQTLVVIIDPSGRTRAVRRIPKTIREVVRDMSDSNRHEFGHRLIAIARAHLGRRQGQSRP